MRNQSRFKVVNHGDFSGVKDFNIRGRILLKSAIIAGSVVFRQTDRPWVLIFIRREGKKCTK